MIVKDGNTSQPAPSAGLLDSTPRWGTTADLFYGRMPPGSSTVRLWFASGGNPPHGTGLRVWAIGSTALAWAWSATRPVGIG